MPENTSLPNYMIDNRGIVKDSIKSTLQNSENPQTFRVSEEEGARLRAMAMKNNGSEMSPEMQAAMKMVNGDYDQKVPDRVHNYICYDEARKNNEKYREEASEFTNAIVQDNATREILDEAIAEVSDELMEKFFAGEPFTEDEIKSALKVENHKNREIMF